MICIWHPFSCDTGLDGTLPSHIERVADEFAICILSHDIHLSFMKKQNSFEISQTPAENRAIWRQIRTVRNIETVECE